MLLGVKNTTNAQVAIYFDKDTSIANSGATKHINAHLVNLGPTAVKIHPTVSINTLTVIGAGKDSIIIPAHDTVLLPVNLYIPRKAKADSLYKLHIEVTVPHVIYAHFYNDAIIKIEHASQIYTTIVESEKYIRSPSEVIEVKLQCSNIGNAGETVHFNIINQFIGEKGKVSSVNYYIPAFSDTSITLRYFLPELLFTQNNIQLHVIGEFANNNNIFSSHLFNVFNINSKKIYSDQENFTTISTTNAVGVFVRDAGSENKYYEVTADVNNQLKSGDLHYHVDGFVNPKNNGSNPFMLMNSYINYTGNNGLSFKAGDIYRSLEMPLAGRGINVKYSDNDKKQYEIGYINGNDNIVGDFKLGGFTPYNSLFGSYTNKISESTQLKSQVIEYFDPFNHANSTLFGGSLDWNKKRKHYFSLGLYNSFTSNAAYDSVKQKLGGAAVSFSANSFFKKWQFLSNNYLSSNSYAGLQKGAVNLEEKINYTIKNNFNVWVRYHQFSYSPNYLSIYASFLNLSYHMETVEAGIERRFGRTALTVKPYYYTESNTYNAAGVVYPQSISSKRINVLFNYSTLNHQFFSISTDVGASTSNNIAYQQFTSWKIAANYQYKRFAVNAYLQDGPFYPTELNVFAATGKKYQLFTIGPSFNGAVFHRRLMLNVSDFISYDNSYQKWSNNISLHGSYKLPHSMSLEMNYYQMRSDLLQNNSFVNSRIDIGLVKKLGTQKTRKGDKGSLELLVYLDLNGNDHYDTGEPLSVNAIVRINSEIFTTDLMGKVVYSNIPGGDYTISVMQSAGYVGENASVFVNGKTYLQIPLHKMAMLKGSILLQKQEFSYETDESINNIRIIATDSKGKNYTALTNDQGEFVMYLPENDYEMHINTASLPAQYELMDVSKNVKVTNGYNNPVIFKVLVKKRQINIKKFGANGQAN